VKRNWRRLQSEKLHELYSSQDKKDEVGMVYGTYGGQLNSGFWWGNLNEREHLGDMSVEERILLQ